MTESGKDVSVFEGQATNPNNIGDYFMVTPNEDIPTSRDKVYRSVYGEAAINDLFDCGFVRNKLSAGLVERSRYGHRVFWSRGVEGLFHNIQTDGFVIEAPFEVASSRVVREVDVTAIYTKDGEGNKVNILEERRKMKP